MSGSTALTATLLLLLGPLHAVLSGIWHNAVGAGIGLGGCVLGGVLLSSRMATSPAERWGSRSAGATFGLRLVGKISSPGSAALHRLAYAYVIFLLVAIGIRAASPDVLLETKRGGEFPAQVLPGREPGSSRIALSGAHRSGERWKLDVTPTLRPLS